MRERNSYSRFIQNLSHWTFLEKGEMIQLLHHCVERNITSFDNANFYGKSHTGHRFGTALSETGLSRDEIQLISKFSAESGSNLLETVENILLDLDTDYLDLLLLDPSRNYEETHAAIEQLFSQGKILELGSLNMNSPEMEATDVIFHAKLIKNPVRSLHDLKMIEPEIHPDEKIVNLVYCDLNGNLAEVEAAREMCDKYDLNEDQLLLAWILKHPAHLHPVISFTQKEQISAATSVKENLLAPIDWQKLNLMVSGSK